MSRQYFGKRKDDGAKIYLTDPSWDCGWYWGFGYLGNIDEHYHLKAFQSKNTSHKKEDGTYFHETIERNINMHDALLEDYELVPNVKENLWSFCELVETAYVLKETAEVLGRGGSHYTANLCKDIVVNKDEVKRINDVVLPAIFKEINKIFKGEN